MHGIKHLIKRQLRHMSTGTLLTLLASCQCEVQHLFMVINAVNGAG